MKDASLTIPAKINKETFRRFAIFDTFYHQKHWKLPAIFAVVMTALAVLSFSFHARREGALFLGGVLLTIGLGLPLAYVLSYLLSLRQQMARMDLRGEKIAYTLQLDSAGIQAAAGSQRAFYSWETVCMAYRVPGCIYLYVAPKQAYLLPEDASTQRLWALLESCLPPEKLYAHTKDTAV